MASHDWIEAQSYSLGSSQFASDGFIFNDGAKSNRGGVVVAAGDVNDAHPHHTPEWSNPRSSDPAETPGADDLAGLPAVQTDGTCAGAHALYQDLVLS